MKTEIDIIQDYVNGTQEGIVYTPDCFFMPVRITGLGYSNRVDDETSIKFLQEATQSQSADLNELVQIAYDKNLQPSNFIRYKRVDRDRSAFSNLDMYNGLPIIVDHPKDENFDNTLLSYDIISQAPIVGVITKAYHKNNAIWGVGKFYDKSVLKILDEFKSTSPAVVSIDCETPLGIKEKPLFLNHLALVRRGHWDFQGTNAIDNSKITNLEGETMLAEKIDNAPAIEEQATADVVPEEATPVDSVEEAIVDSKEEVKVDAEEAETEVKSDKEEEVKADEEVKTDEEVKVDTEEVVEVQDNEVAEIPDEEVEVTHNVEKVEDEEEEVIDEETPDDKERVDALREMRKVVDEASWLTAIKMPYFEKRVSGVEAKRVFMSKNYSYLDSKYDGLVLNADTTRGHNAKLNKVLIDEAFESTLENIRKNVKERTPVNTERNWIMTDKPNVKVIPGF